jgi:ABC-type multidrug transport system fused ATPase/permease subunit
MNRLRVSWSLIKASWKVLRQDKQLAIFSLLSLALYALVLILLVFGAVAIDSYHFSEKTESWSYFVLGYLFYLALYFVGIFFGSAIVAFVHGRFSGMSPTIGSGFRMAVGKLPLIAEWAVVAGTVGFILKIIEEKSESAGNIIAAILGGAWDVATFLIVPLLVLEGKRPLEALKESAHLLKKTWGEQLIGNVGFTLIFLGLMLPAVLVVGLGVIIGTKIAMQITIVIAVAYVVALVVAQITLEGIFRTALYYYARHASLPHGFSDELLGNALRSVEDVPL